MEYSELEASMSVFVVLRVLIGLLALIGAAAIAIVVMLASPVRPPPPLASIHAGAAQIDEMGAPDLSRQARDGTSLAYRLLRPQTERGTGLRSSRTALRPARLR